MCVRACVRDVITLKMRRPRSDLACSVIEKNGLHLARTIKMSLRTRGVKVWIHIFLGVRWLHCKIYIIITAIYSDVHGIHSNQMHIRHRFLSRSVHPVTICITRNGFSVYWDAVGYKSEILV